MIGIVIVANGNLAVELHDCLEQIIGKQPAIVPIPIAGNHDRKEKEREICDAVCSVDAGQGVIVLTDIFGSSPANLSICACKGRNSVILTGVNLPMLIKLAKSRSRNLTEAACLASEAGRQHIKMFDRI